MKPTASPPNLWRQIQEDWRAHGRDWTRPGFRALAVHRLGVWRMTIRTRWLRAPWSVLYRMLFRYCRNHYGVEIPDTAVIGRRVVFEHQHGVVVHGGSVIGDDCILRQGVTLGLRRIERPHEAPTLGRGVDVGAGAKLLGKIVVGDHARIGANAVVLADVPGGVAVVGIPARIVAARELDEVSA